MTRRFPVGAELNNQLASFRVWAPKASAVRVAFANATNRPSGRTLELDPEPGGYFSGTIKDVSAGDRYWIELDDGARFPDPASRFQPDGPHGPSEVIDSTRFAWSDGSWSGVSASPVVYEMHIGTFTAEGTWAAAARELPALADTGISLIEVLPVAEFAGRFGWGYDGVHLYSPTRLYGRPDDFRAFVDRAHALGIAVILDVVYNHFGPDGCALARFSDTWFAEHLTEWGQAINFDGPGCEPVREFCTANAGYWMEEFHLDGLRLDATQSIADRRTPHVVSEIADAVRRHAHGRRTWIVGENEPQHTSLLRPQAGGGCGLDALWNDDFHHSAMVALTGKREAYYTDYLGAPQEFISAARRGFLYQGQWYSWQRAPRGQSTRTCAAHRFVAFLQNHDQVANSFAGERVHQVTSPGRYRAMTALLLLGPWTPMLFQGQEFAASTPFLYFADHEPELASGVRSGRREFLSQFPSLAGDDVAGRLADPGAPDTFRRSQLDHAERERHRTALDLHRSLIALRRGDPAFHGHHQFSVDGAVLSEHAFVLRFIENGAHDTASSPDADRLLVVNLGRQLTLSVMPEPLLSPYPRTAWRAIWTSEDPRYGGSGVADTVFKPAWTLPAECAIVLAPDPES